MSFICRFSSCKWQGSQDEIFAHVESDHKKFLREPKGKIYFDFSLEDLQQETFILCSLNGLYWFGQKLQPTGSNGIDFGLFHIGESEQVEYVLKLGLKRDGYWEYWGPHTSQQASLQPQPNQEETYNLKFDYQYLEFLNKTMPSRRLRLYFGEYDDSDDQVYLRPQDIEWNEENDRRNLLLVERFTCAVCFEYIRRDVRFCDNKHYVCLNCFEEMVKRKKLKCPICRGQYWYDCMDPELERLLAMIKWPDMSDTNKDQEVKLN